VGGSPFGGSPASINHQPQFFEFRPKYTSSVAGFVVDRSDDAFHYSANTWQCREIEFLPLSAPETQIRDATFHRRSSLRPLSTSWLWGISSVRIEPVDRLSPSDEDWLNRGASWQQF
jgi:hypothetical protein